MPTLKQPLGFFRDALDHHFDRRSDTSTALGGCNAFLDPQQLIAPVIHHRPLDLFVQVHGGGVLFI